MFKLKSVEKVPMTKNLARTILNLERVPGERCLSKSRLQHLQREIENGTITSFNWVTAEDLETGTTYRVNGQHTSHIFANGTDASGTVILQKYECKNLEEVVSLWSRYDAPFSSRSTYDVMQTVFESDNRLQGLPKFPSRLAARAVAMATYGTHHAGGVSSYETALASQQNAAFVRWACDVFHKRSVCSRLGVFLAAFHTYKSKLGTAIVRTFWEEVQSGSNPDPKSGSRALQLLLTEYSANGGQRTGKKALTWDATAEFCLLAWNQWIDNKAVKQWRRKPNGLAHYMTLPEGPRKGAKSKS